MDFLLQNSVIILGTVATGMILVKWFHSEKYISRVKKYVEFYDKKDATNRISKYNVMVDNFYTIVTDFYMWGWGESFHFAPRNKDETFKESIKRIEYYLSSRLGLTKDKYVLDKSSNWDNQSTLYYRNATVADNTIAYISKISI